MMGLEAKDLPGMTPVGETLRRARLKRNLELNRIADELKISVPMLQAIEEEHFEKLPGRVFVRSFVRQYARLLELDEDEVLGSLQQTFGPTPQLPQPAAPAELPQGGISLPRVNGWQAIGDPAPRWASPVRALGLVIVVLLACAGAYTWLEKARRPVTTVHKQKPAEEQKVAVHATTAPPAQPAPASEPPAEAAARPVEPSRVAETHSAAGSSLPESKIGAAPGAAAAAPSESASSTVPAAALAANVNPDAPVRVEVVADEDSWVSLSADGKSAFTGVMTASQSRSVGASRDVRLKVGNAGGVTVRLNGKAIGSFGAAGEVKTLQLTSGGFKILPPDVPKPAPPTDPANP